MTLTDRALGHPKTRSERARARRARVTREVEPVAREARIRPAGRQRVRRRYDLALPSAGAAVRLPALPVVRFGPRLLSALLLAATLFALQHAFTAPGFRVGEASVLGSRIVSIPQARSIAGLGGLSVFEVDPVEAVRRLVSHPEVASARVSVRWPNQVEIELTERHPMVEWNDAGRTWWICPDGVAYLQHGTWPGLVQIASEKKSLNITEDPLAPVIPIGVMRAAAVLNAQIPDAAQLLYDPDHGLGFQDSRGWVAFFGVEGDMVLKARIYDALAAVLESSKARVGFVSVEDPATPYYRQTR
jgi:hypothetical protein